MPSKLDNARELFLHAVGKLPPERWEVYVAEACGGDVELERQVRHLLHVHLDAGSFLENPAVGLGATSDVMPGHAAEAPNASLEGSGTVIGPYKLLQQIGEGGMGTVWMAEQQYPVQRKVALKLIKPGMDSRQVLARFEAERQALALMDHPNIAKVLDAGATHEGRPYFVMELVKGVPTTRYCDEHRLTPRQRLELFVSVCQAVQHAHQKGIIHRDLKPSNVLVAPYDGKPVVKVIDFGVAKATGQRLTDKTLFTEFGAVIGTLEYMSPEQAELNNQDIDTRSDIYSLGVLLYELLTGTTPLDRTRLKHAAFTEMLRMVREVEPPKPSTRLSESKDTQASISAQRQTEPAKLTKLVRGELDWIVMKALEKDRNRRYETANGFAMDLQRYLADEPVQACPPSARYRFRKFARRNKVALLTTGLVAAALVIGAAVSVWQAVEAHSARRLADDRLDNETQARRDAEVHFQKALEAVDRMLYQVADEKVVHPQMESLRRRLQEDATAFYTDLIALNPHDAKAHVKRGRVYYNLPGKLEQASSDFEKAIELDPENAEAHAWLGCLLADNLTGNWGLHFGADARAAGLSYAKRAVELQPTQADLHACLGWIHAGAGRIKDAAAALRKAAELCGSDSAERYFYSAEAELVDGNYRTALANYEKCLAHGPRIPRSVGAWARPFIIWAVHMPPWARTNRPWCLLRRPWNSPA